MKLNENGDFCLLYVEPADEKQSLFALIGEQQKPVVLMLPQAGQPRAKLFQRPEDFSDLKHVRRQSGVSIVFLTAGSELLAQMATRYGFPSYPSMDDFADFLAHGQRSPRDESLYPLPLRRARTGPLIPSATAAQLAALRRSILTGPLSGQAEGEPWTGRERSIRPGDPLNASEPWTGHGHSVRPAGSLNASEPWTGHESGVRPDQMPGTGSHDGIRPIHPLKSEPWAGYESDARPKADMAQPMAMEYEYTAAFHLAQTAPLGGPARLTWPQPGEDVSSVLSTTPTSLDSLRNPPPAPKRVHGYQGGSLERGLSTPAEEAGAQQWLSEIPRRRSSTGPVEPHTRHPGWQAEERMFESGPQARLSMPAGSAQGPRIPPSRPTRDLREQTASYNPAGNAPARPTRDLREQTASYGRTGNAPARPTRDLREQQLLAAGMASVSHASGSMPARPTRDLREQQLLAAGMADVAEVPTAPGKRPASAPPVHPAHKRGSVWPLMVILTLLIITGGALGSFVAIAHVAPTASATPHPVGSIAFLSSEQLNENTSQGVNDQMQISLHSLSTPAPGNSYYAWLLGDAGQSEAQAIPLGKLIVHNGATSLFYAGDAQHTNLLQITSRFLVTEEKSSVAPLMPSLDNSTWRYYGALPAVPDPNDTHHYSFLNHLRHLLADEPILDELELPGGLNNWFTRNTQELIQLTSSARDRWQNGHGLSVVRSQGVQILSYLDGMSFVMQDLPAVSANVQQTLDMHQAALGLLNVRSSTQNPPGYIDQIVYHLNGLINAPGSPGNVRSTASQVLPVLSTIATWLQKLRSDDKSLLAMNNTHLGQGAALSLLDDMVLQASNVYSGSTRPATGQAQPGVTWIHQQLQSIATLAVNTYIVGQTPVPEVAPSSKPGPAFLLPLLKLWKELE